jgi:phosphatidylinositol-3,4,5-trisphosphate 3-phosphatase/dual-specificity protein phosphatase PTEN
MSNKYNPIKKEVSKNNNKYTKDGYNLDLTYITDKVIGMSYPASKTFEKIYRNDVNKVARFFNSIHGNHYHIYNMSNRDIDTKKFDNNVTNYEWEDHHSPALIVLFEACKSMFAFILKDYPHNVVSVHCNAGKGRTGSTISCFLMYSGLSDNFLDAMTYYGQKRFKTGRGVTQPS